MTEEYRIEYSIQRCRESDDDFVEIGFGSSGAWSDLDQCAHILSSAVQNGKWETAAPATPIEEPADYSPLCAECEAADREQPMCNDCHATFQREHAARTARARRLGSAGPVKEDRP